MILFACTFVATMLVMDPPKPKPPLGVTGHLARLVECLRCGWLGPIARLRQGHGTRSALEEHGELGPGFPVCPECRHKELGDPKPKE